MSRKLNYSSFAQTFEIGMTRKNMSGEANALFEFMCDEEDIVKNRNGERFEIRKTPAGEWYRGEAELPKVLVDAAGNSTISAKAPKAFSKICEKMINGQKLELMLDAMANLVKEGVESEEEREYFLSLKERGEDDEFLARTFLYAIVQSNKETESALLPDDHLNDEDQAEIDMFEDILRKHAKPDAKEPPVEIDTSREMGYVSQMLIAFSDVAGMEVKSRKELESFPEYKEDFEDQRRYFYAAETVHEVARDTYRIQDKDGFDKVKKEIKSGVKDDWDLAGTSGPYIRMKKTLSSAVHYNLSANTNRRLLGWISADEKKGVCHVLVNEGELWWKK